LTVPIDPEDAAAAVAVVAVVAVVVAVVVAAAGAVAVAAVVFFMRESLTLTFLSVLVIRSERIYPVEVPTAILYQVPSLPFSSPRIATSLPEETQKATADCPDAAVLTNPLLTLTVPDDTVAPYVCAGDAIMILVASTMMSNPAKTRCFIIYFIPFKYIENPLSHNRLPKSIMISSIIIQSVLIYVN
jgi:hypothetical protein